MWTIRPRPDKSARGRLYSTFSSSGSSKYLSPPLPDGTHCFRQFTTVPAKGITQNVMKALTPGLIFQPSGQSAVMGNKSTANSAYAGISFPQST